MVVVTIGSTITLFLPVLLLRSGWSHAIYPRITIMLRPSGL
ncbi:MAG: hypothetical protein WCP16_05905 [Pseudanabaena sp. ELA645]